MQYFMQIPADIKFLTDLMVPPYDDPHGDGTLDTLEYYLVLHQN